MEVIKIARKLEKVQDDKRFFHTMGVAVTSANLAMRYGEDKDKAYLAGLLHDCAKHLSDEKLMELSLKYNINVSEVEKKSVFLLHGKVGALIANKKFDIDDEDILNAIRFHTTGRPGMSLLEKIVFVADYIEPTRYKQKNLTAIRSLAFENIDVCVTKILSDTLDHLKEKDYSIDETTQETYDYYVKESLFNDK